MKRITGKAAKKKTKRNINKKLMIVVFIVALAVGIVLMISLPTVRNIEVTIKASTSNEENTAKLTKEDIIALSELKVGDKLFQNLRSEISKKIEQNSYVDTAKISRSLSGKVEIEVTQREPKYLINYSGEYIYIDREGYILEINSQNNGTPIIIGFSTDFSKLDLGKNKVRLNQKDLEKLKVINNIMATIESNGVENKINSIDVTDSKEFILHLEEDGKTVYIGDGSDLNTRILYMRKILESESGHTGIIYINGNLDEGYVYFKEQ